MVTTRTPKKFASRLAPPSLHEQRPISRERWHRHREMMMAQCGPGERPEEWWVYEMKMRPPVRQAGTIWLFNAGELTESELAELLPEWREAYKRAQRPGFSYCIGSRPGETFAYWLEGPQARKAFFRWSAIPSALVKKWNVERRRAERHID